MWVTIIIIKLSCAILISVRYTIYNTSYENKENRRKIIFIIEKYWRIKTDDIQFDTEEENIVLRLQ